MDTVLSILHVAGAVFIVGPMAILPMTAMRSVRAGDGAQVARLAKSTNLFTLLSLLVVVFGFGVLGMASGKHIPTFASTWIWLSIVLYAIALILSLVLVVPTMRKAAAALQTSGTAGAPAGSGSAADAAPAASRYPAIAAGSGIASLLLLAVVVLMVWKP
ncbi:DUF2269 family protein [Rathayibacter soli]|uniref:DUF2269 family protein n=1 Tax=Rathayibacter soli TaxID=3144168 RepID=UPI0027E4FA7D|nr:DUF2269 family protein [Glaciibacter superstes]